MDKLKTFIEAHFQCSVNKTSHGVNFTLHDIGVDLLSALTMEETKVPVMSSFKEKALKYAGGITDESFLLKWALF